MMSPFLKPTFLFKERVFLREFPQGNSPSSPTLTFSGSHAINFHKPYKKSQPKEQLVMLEEEVMKAYFL